MDSTVSANEFFTKLVWANLWNPKSPYYLPNVITNGISQAGVTVSPLGNFQIANLPPTGSLQLMESHDLANWLPIKTGYIGIEFSNIVISELGTVTDGGLTYTDDPTDLTKGSIVANINLPGISINGNYVVVATGLAQCAVDTAGAISFLPGGFDAIDSLKIDDNPELDQYLNAARDQRTKLWQTPNGGKLMGKYYDHNETFNWLFQNSANVQTSWQMPANKYFMQQTYAAATSPHITAVNNGIYTDSDNNTTSYNDNAFSQQITLTFSALGFDRNPPPNCPITSQQFNDAGNAAADFGNNQVASTGNTQDNITPKTIPDVYTDVSNYQAPDSGMLVVRHDLDSYTQQLNEKQLAYLKKIQDMVDEKAALKAAAQDASATMVMGTFGLTVNSGQLIMDADLTFPATGNASAKVTGLSATISIGAININNISDWSIGKLESIGSLISTALENSAFIRNLLSDKLNDELGSDTVKNYLSTWLNDTMAKVLGPLLGET